MPYEEGLKTMKLKEPCRSGFVREHCQMIWEMKRKWGEGKGGRLNHTFFTSTCLLWWLTQNSTTELIKGLMKLRKKYLSGRERGAGWKSTLLKYRQLQKDQPKRFLRDQAILTHTHKDRDICFMNQKMIADMSPSAFFWVTFFSIWHTFGTHVVVKDWWKVILKIVKTKNRSRDSIWRSQDGRAASVWRAVRPDRGLLGKRNQRVPNHCFSLWLKMSNLF